MAEVKITIEALDQVSKKLDDIDKKAQKTKKSIENLGKVKVKEPSGTSIRAKSTIASQTAELSALDKISNKAVASLNKLEEKQKALIARTIYKQDQSNIKQLTKSNESLLKRNQAYQDAMLRVTPINYLANQMGVIRKIEGGKTILASELDSSKHGIFKPIDDYKGNYNKFLKVNFEKELKETLSKRKTENQQKVVIEKKLAREQDLLNKERSRAIVQETMFQKKIADGLANAKATPINYIKDASGKIIGVAKAGAQATAIQFASIKQLGGGSMPPPPSRGRGGDESGFLGGRRTFGQVLGGYLAYRTAVTTESGVSSALSVAPNMEGLRAQISAMIYASGVRDKKELERKTEEQINFLYKTGSKYGKNFLDIAPEYTRMLGVSSIKGSKFNNKQIQDITEAFLGLSSVSGLSSERTKLVFLAVSQMLGKGFIRGQELNQQLREQLPIATPMIEEAVKRTLNDPSIKGKNPKIAQLYDQYKKGNINLDDLVEKGIVGSGNLIHMLKVMQDVLGTMPQEKAKIFTAQMQTLFGELTMLTDNLTKDKIGYVSKGISSINQSLQSINQKFLDQDLNPNKSVYEILNTKNKSSKEITNAMLFNAGKEGVGNATIGLATYLGLGLTGSGLAKLGLKGASRFGFGALAGPIGMGVAGALTAYDIINGIKGIETYLQEKVQESDIQSVFNKTYKGAKNTNYFEQNPIDIAEAQINNAMDFENYAKKQLISNFKTTNEPQKVELILRFEGGNLPNGIKPVITTSRGSPLNLGVNIISGGVDKSYGY